MAAPPNLKPQTVLLCVDKKSGAVFNARKCAKDQTALSITYVDGTGTAASLKSASDAIAGLKSRMATVQAGLTKKADQWYLDDLSSAVSQLSQNLDDVLNGVDLADLGQSVQSAQSGVDDLNSQVRSLSGQLQTVSEALDVILNGVDLSTLVDLGQAVESAQGAVDALRYRMNAVEPALGVKADQSAVDDLTVRVDDLADLIVGSSIDETLVDLSQAVESTLGALDAFWYRMDAVESELGVKADQSAVDDLTVRVDDLADLIAGSSIDADLEALREGQQALDARIVSLESIDFSRVADDIALLQSDLAELKNTKADGYLLGQLAARVAALETANQTVADQNNQLKAVLCSLEAVSDDMKASLGCTPAP